jgi:hypothetical protein
MAAFEVSSEQVMTVDTFSMNLSMDYIAAPDTSVRVYKNGLLLTLHADYDFSNIVQYPYYTTFTLDFVQEVLIGETIRIEKDEEWNQWIQFVFPNIDGRLQALENKITTANNIAARLLVLETNLAAAQADILTLSSIVSNNSIDIGNAQLDITNIQNAIVANTIEINKLKAFLGVEAVVTINNNQIASLEIPELETDGYVYSSVKVEYEIMRMIGVEYRSSVGILNLVCKGNGVWYTERGLTVIDLDGVTFTIATAIGRIGKISYTSDLMSGAGYVGTFKIRVTKFEV